ncbi:MAG TPA: cytochrome c oxidase subunit II [Planctomycetota bacterium]|nr:cytochrome c oxidase subunit II [Planctomycetota bacterium]
MINRLRFLALRAAAIAAVVAAFAGAQQPDAAPAADGHTAGYDFLGAKWLQERASADDTPVEIDRLFVLILWITTVTAVLVFGTLVYFLLKYRGRPGRKAFFTHGSHKVEVAWTIVPALILIWLALVQANTWLDIKAPDRMPDANDPNVTFVRVLAQQFQWNFRHAGANEMFERFDQRRFDGDLAAFYEASKVETEKAEKGQKNRLPKSSLNPKGFNPKRDEDTVVPLVRPNALADAYWSNDDDDDVVDTAELVLPVGRRVLVDLRSVDVIHSFYIPAFRVKQDAVPGKPMPVWFHPTKLGVYDLMCAELCGSGHTKMKAKVRVVTLDEYRKYVAEQSAAGTGKVNRSMAKANSDVWRTWPAQDKTVLEARLK